MEYLRRKNGKTAEFLARIIPCSEDEKSRKREKKNPTPPRNSRGIGGGVGEKDTNVLNSQTNTHHILDWETNFLYMFQTHFSYDK